MPSLFFRNDDVRNSLNDGLVEMTDIFIKHKVPISHAVEPANVSSEVVQWLLNIKTMYPDLIEIIQHGYDHNARNLYPSGSEFGGKRDYRSQYTDIQKGGELMNEYFGTNWSRIMTFPYGRYNNYTIQVLDELQYVAISTSVSYSLHRKILNITGQFFKKNILFGKKIPYHTTKRPNTNIYDFGVSVNFIKEYINEYKCIHHSKDAILAKLYLTRKYTDVIGVLLHHRFHRNEINLIRSVIESLTTDNRFQFKKISDLL